RIRRAINCEYCPPKSRTRTSSAAGSVIRDGDSRGDGRAAVRAHADRLVALELLALGLERGGNHHLRPLEVADVLVAAGGHRGAERPDQVERAVVLLGGAEQDLLERAVLNGRDAGSPRQR